VPRILAAIYESIRRRWSLYLGGSLVVLLAWSAFSAHGGTPDPTDTQHLSHGAVIVDSGLLVFREGLETILVLAAVTASLAGAAALYRRPIAIGAGAGFLLTVATWCAAVWVLGQLGAGGLAVQAATGLLAVIVLLVVMNWFFHKVYWTGWISMHSRRKQELMKESSPSRLWLGLALLGFTSVYREGFEVVLFLQSYRLKLGTAAVMSGVAIGFALTLIVGVLTFVAHRRLPYRRMLVLTGVMLGLVMLVMVGEQAQEMQLANWLPTTPIASLSHLIPDWMGLWFAVFPTAETLAAQAFAAALVIGSYFLAREQTSSHVAVNS